jgi:uncharacterized membrane-anchored protein YitT (DUF2179 family)
MNLLRNNKSFIDYLYVFIGNILLAFAITSILKPNGLITGGITGISIIFDNIMNIKYTYIYYILSILVLVSARVFLGKREALKIVFISISFPLILILFEQLNIHFVENDMLLASIYYGIIGGIGAGLILKRGFSAGGTDTIAKILHRKIFPFVSISQILLGIDTAIIVLSIFIFDKNTALYAILTQFILMKSIDTVLFGLGSKKVKIEIISDENEKIQDYIINSVKRGISVYDIKGGYTNSRKRKIVSICSPRESMLIKKFIAEMDSNAFVYVLPVVSAWGRGLGFDSLIDEQ